MRAVLRAAAALSVVSLLAAPAVATTYQRVADADLADQAAVIVEARVVGSGAASDGRRPATDYRFAVERAIRGAAAGDRLTVRVPGGQRSSGPSLQIWGAPRFEADEPALLFLAPNADGSLHVLHLMLGAFHEAAAGDGRRAAVRDLAEAKEVSGAPADPPRDLDRFRAWLADRAAGVRRTPDYFLSAGALADTARPLAEKFNLLNANGVRMRWFAFDPGGSVAWAANSAGQPGVPGGGFAEFQRALAAWNAEPATPIHYAYIGQTNASGGLRQFDGVNAIQFEQPVADPFDCDRGGILAIGGPWFDTRQRVTWGGQGYIPITGADISTNAGVGCYLARSANPSKAAEEIFGHELGHTLGLSHSCGVAASGDCAVGSAGDDALMRAYLHNDGRGARLAADDVAALQSLYRPGTGQALAPPAAPTQLTATAAGLDADLLWEDRSADEQGFRVYRRTGSGRLARIAELPAGATIYVDRELKAGTRYEYQVSAFNPKGESRGPRVALATSAAVPLQALSLASRAVTARTGEPVDFSASFSGPARQARWDFSGGSAGIEISDAPCAAGSFCATHIFTQPGDQRVTVRLLGDLGQAAPERTLRLHVDGPALTPGDGESFLPDILAAPALSSDLWLANDGVSPTLVRATFLPRDAGAAGAAPISRDLTLAPGATLLLPDVLQSLFGASGGIMGEGSLALSYLLPPSMGGSGPRVLAFSHARSTADSSAMGSFGPLLGEEPADGWSAGEKVLAGLPGGDGSTASLLVGNLDATGGQITLGLFDSLGQPVGSPALLDLGPGASLSRRLDGLFPALVGHTGPFSARVQSNGIRFSVSALLRGGELAAPLFLPAKPAGPAGPDGTSPGELLIPRVSRGPGAFNTFQFSRLVAANPSAQPRQLLCQLWLRGQDGRTSNRIVTLTVPPQGSAFVEDVLHDLFGLSEGLGALRITWNGAEGPAPRVLSFAISSASGGMGSRFAALVDGRGSQEAATARSVSVGAEPSAFARSSWGAVNLGDAPATLRLSLRGPSGEVVSSAQVTLRPRQPFERTLAGVFPQAGAQAGDGRWTVAADVLGGGPVQTYLFQTGAGGDVSFLPGSAD
jgi:hypothetical protein